MKSKQQPLPEAERRAILRAADDIIAQGGRTLLSKILKGSKDRKVLELGLNKNPSYGFYSELTLERILDKVDDMIDWGFLDIQKQGKLPMIIFTPFGWAIERERYAEELLQEWDHWLEHNVTPISMDYLKERNRGMMFLFLYKILCSANKKYIPYLTLWERIDFKKVQAEIRQVIEALNRREALDEGQWNQLLRDRAESLLIWSGKPIILPCEECGGPLLFDVKKPEYYRADGLSIPKLCRYCMAEEQAN
jgi:hypothetical protein